MKKYMDRDGDVWAGADDSALFLIETDGYSYGIGIPKSHIERQIGELTPLEED